jgi:hypothetical protein
MLLVEIPWASKVWALPLTRATGAIRRTAWYHKRAPTFSDALAVVRKELWAQEESRLFAGRPHRPTR